MARDWLQLGNYLLDYISGQLNNHGLVRGLDYQLGPGRQIVINASRVGAKFLEDQPGVINKATFMKALKEHYLFIAQTTFGRPRGGLRAYEMDQVAVSGYAYSIKQLEQGYGLDSSKL